MDSNVVDIAIGASVFQWQSGHDAGGVVPHASAPRRCRRSGGQFEYRVARASHGTRRHPPPAPMPTPTCSGDCSAARMARSAAAMATMIGVGLRRAPTTARLPPRYRPAPHAPARPATAGEYDDHRPGRLARRGGRVSATAAHQHTGGTRPAYDATRPDATALRGPSAAADVACAADDPIRRQRVRDELRDLEVQRTAAQQHHEADLPQISCGRDRAQRSKRIDDEDAFLGGPPHGSGSAPSNAGPGSGSCCARPG